MQPTPEPNPLVGVHRPNLTCVVCGTHFFRQRVRDDRGSGRHCCSLKCVSVLAHRAERHFVTPESTKEERVRANGIVNRRLKLGWFDKPTTCAKCGQPHHRISSHHFDYAKPLEVIWLCPGCHTRSHHNPTYLDGVPVFVCDRKKPAKPRHNRGGRRGPTGKAKGRDRLVRIVSVDVEGWRLIEQLICGHTHERAEDGRRPAQRRCKTCGPATKAQVAA